MDPRKNEPTAYARQADRPEGPQEYLLTPQETGHSPSEPLRKRRRLVFQKTWFHFLVAFLASALFAVTGWFAQGKWAWTSGTSPSPTAVADCKALGTATFSEQSTNAAAQAIQNALKIDVTSTLTVLSILSGLLSACTGYVLSKTLEIVLWASASSGAGVNCLTFLGMSPSTGVFGTLGIVLTGRASLSDRAWSALRSVCLSPCNSLCWSHVHGRHPPLNPGLTLSL
jgi:hypothetical protein